MPRRLDKATVSTSTREIPQSRASRQLEMIETAVGIIEATGLRDFSIRKLATRMATSTMSIYSLFGGKDELLAAVRLHAVSEQYAYFARAVRSGHGNCVEQLYHLAAGYRRFACEEPTLYGIIMDAPGYIPGWTPEALNTSRSFQYLVHMVGEGQENGEFISCVSSKDIAEALWAGIHGIVSLEYAGFFESVDEAQRAFDNVLPPIVNRFLV